MYKRAKLLLTLIAASSRGDPCTQYFWVVRRLARRCRASLALITAFLFVACAPTYAPHLEAPEEASPAPTAIAIAPLDPAPHLPDADQAPCPRGSGLAACFTHDQDLVRQARFKILHDDRDYCRDAYARAVNRAAGN
jgi:hypothetical protein